MVKWELYTAGKERETQVIAPDVFPTTGYVRQPILITYNLHLWDYPQELWVRINQDQSGGLWK